MPSFFFYQNMLHWFQFFSSIHVIVDRIHFYKVLSLKISMQLYNFENVNLVVSRNVFVSPSPIPEFTKADIVSDSEYDIYLFYYKYIQRSCLYLILFFTFWRETGHKVSPVFSITFISQVLRSGFTGYRQYISHTNVFGYDYFHKNILKNIFIIDLKRTLHCRYPSLKLVTVIFCHCFIL